jgi:hypothetical protein
MTTLTTGGRQKCRRISTNAAALLLTTGCGLAAAQQCEAVFEIRGTLTAGAALHVKFQIAVTRTD